MSVTPCFKYFFPGIQSAIQIEDPGEAAIIHQGTGTHTPAPGTTINEIVFVGNVLGIFLLKEIDIPLRSPIQVQTEVKVA